MKTDKELLESYFGKEALSILPLNYKYAKIFRPTNEITEEEQIGMVRHFSNDYYKTDYAAINTFFKTI